MTQRSREVETLLLTMYAAVPLYLTGAIGAAPLVVFHLVMLGIVLRVAAGKGPEMIPVRLMRWIAISYVPFYVIDAAVISRSAIAASTHLVLFIAVYQPGESLHRPNHAQRLLTATLIFIASLATSTHVAVVAFVAVFAYFMFRQLMHVSHLETVSSIGIEAPEAPSGGVAAFYLAGAVAIGAALFPILPRVRSPFIHGITGTLSGATTALSDTIDFNQPRVTPPDTTVVARVWMDRRASAFFSPIRLRGNLYEHYYDREWRQSFRGLKEVRRVDRAYVLSRPGGIEATVRVQQRAQRGKLFLPVGTVALTGLNNLYEGPAQESFYTYQDGTLTLDVRLAGEAEPLRPVQPGLSGYRITPQVAGLALRIVGNEQRPERQAALIEQYMIRNFRYQANPSTPAGGKTIEQFLLRDRAGHCEYFAAGMVVLLNSLDVPARIAGGFYGGRFNPLTGYYSIRREDAHAWTEVWNGTRWVTFDATPPTLRPGSGSGTAISDYLAAVGDSLTFFWDRYVLTFGLADQVALFAEGITRTREVLVAVKGRLSGDYEILATPELGFALALLVAAGISLALLLRRRDPILSGLTAFFAAREVRIGPATTMGEALQCLRENRPEDARAIEPLIAIYEEVRFSPHASRARVAELRRRLDALRSA